MAWRRVDDPLRRLQRAALARRESLPDLLRQVIAIGGRTGSQDLNLRPLDPQAATVAAPFGTAGTEHGGCRRPHREPSGGIANSPQSDAMTALNRLCPRVSEDVSCLRIAYENAEGPPAPKSERASDLH